MSIRFMRFSCQESGQIYMVGTDIEAMRKTAKNLDPTADPSGEEINSERVIEAIKTPRQRDLFEAGVQAARSGTKDYYLFG